MNNSTHLLLAALLACPVVGGAAASSELTLSNLKSGFRAETGDIGLECSRDLGLRVFLRKQGKSITLSPREGLSPAVWLELGQERIADFTLSGAPVKHAGIQTAFGECDRILLKATEPRKTVGLELKLDFPSRYPDVVVIGSRWTNLRSDRAVTIRALNLASLNLKPGRAAAGEVLFWSLQGGGYKWGADFILPVRAGFTQDNYTGPKGNGNGGGLPFVDLWRPDMGVAAALLDPKPTLARLPVETSPDGQAQVRVTTRPSVELPPAGSYAPAVVMIAVHQGDFYDPLVRYRQLMGDLGVRVVTDYQPEDYAPAWCTWGYRRDFTMDGVLAKLPQMQEMGMTDFILDDGWFDLFGNWLPTRQKFPRGEADMKAAIAQIHAAGRKFRLWWSPGSADPGSEMDRQHADWFILDQSGHKEKASWNAYYLCPAYPPVREAMRQLVRRFVADWGTDSFKIDGTSLNHAPLCYNAAHRHARPEESFEQWPELMRQIREEARRLRPGFRVELCPCGITPTFQLATAMEQPTDSDPYVHQVTSRTKFLKAMFGPRSPVLQEYVGVPVADDPSNKPTDIDIYPRAIGTGEVISTFTTMLGPENARWTGIYNRHRPAEGEYLNLYDIGWEKVEGHVIRKAQRLYYGFFTPKPGADYSGRIQLRGLEKQRYRVTNYASGRSLGEVAGPAADLTAAFHDALLLVAEPI